MTVQTITAGYEDMPVLNLSKSGAPPRERLTTATAARNLFTKMRDDDLVNSANRAECHALRDGEPPYEKTQLTEANQSDMTNLNWRGAEQQVERAMNPYYKLVQSPEKLLRVSTTFGPADERTGWEDIMSEEITATIRNSAMFAFQTLMLIKTRTEDGLGIGYFSDDLDWRHRGAGLDQFHFDRQTFACEEEQTVVCAAEDYKVTRLYSMIDGDEEDDDDGEGEAVWNRKAVIAAIQKATENTSDYRDWSRLQDEIKNNDITVEQVCPPVRVINIWIEEFDGTWSHYMTTEEDTGTEEFLYKCRQKYRSLTEILVLFPDGVGANGKIHGYRGLLYKIYPMDQQFNRSVCRLIDQGLLASSIMLQAGDESTLNTTGLEYFGNRAVIGPDWKAVAAPMPDLQRSVMPSIDMMERLRNDRASGYSPENVFDGDQRKTKGEVFAHLDQAASLSDGQLDMHYGPHERLLQQTVRRMTRRTYVPLDPGGREIADLKLRLVRRGVPLEAFYRIDHKATRVVRAIGAGSAAAKTLSLERIKEQKGDMDDVGRYNLNRALAVDAVGAANADEYFPANRIRRTTLDTNVAQGENNDLLNGMPRDVMPSDLHMAHAREHMKPLVEIAQAVEEERLPIEQGAVQAEGLFNHTAEHVDEVTGDPDTLEEAAGMRQALQQIGEMVSNGLKRAKALAEQEAEEGGGEGEPQGPSAEDIIKVEKHRADLEMSRESFEQAQAQKIESARVDDGIKDAKAAAEIARTRAKEAAKARTVS